MLPKEVQVPADVCTHALAILRKHVNCFKHVDKEDEPPIRLLEYGLYGESVEEEKAPFPYMIERNGRWFHSYRFDMELCNAEVHSTNTLREFFGPEDSEADASFRIILGYCVGHSNFKTLSDASLTDILAKSLLPSVLEIYGEQDNPQAANLTSVFSLYASALLPGHAIKMHLDVPEFRGLDRSTCPGWLLVAAHCSGLFSDYRVRNVTTVFYPADCLGGQLAVYPAKELPGKVYSAVAGKIVVLDADSCFHQVAPALAREGQVEVPRLPAKCHVEVEGGQWRVVGEEGDLLASHPEEEIRFSISCKFHVFGSEEELNRYKAGEDPLTAAEILRVMVKDLETRKLLPRDLSLESPLYLLAPVFFHQYIRPMAPRSADIETTWSELLK